MYYSQSSMALSDTIDPFHVDGEHMFQIVNSYCVFMKHRIVEAWLLES